MKRQNVIFSPYSPDMRSSASARKLSLVPPEKYLPQNRKLSKYGKIKEKAEKGGIQMLSISDWISFLSSEKNPNIGIIISFSAFMLAVFAVFMSITNSTPLGAIIAVLVAVALLIVYFLTIGPYGRRARIAGKLLDDIMSG